MKQKCHLAQTNNVVNVLLLDPSQLFDGCRKSRSCYFTDDDPRKVRRLFTNKIKWHDQTNNFKRLVFLSAFLFVFHLRSCIKTNNILKFHVLIRITMLNQFRITIIRDFSKFRAKISSFLKLLK